MTDILKIITELQHTPIPVILVAAGIVFLFLGLSGGISGKIQIPQARHKWAGTLGAIMLLSGLAISIPGGESEPEDGSETNEKLVAGLQDQDELTRTAADMQSPAQSKPSEAAHGPQSEQAPLPDEAQPSRQRPSEAGVTRGEDSTGQREAQTHLKTDRVRQAARAVQQRTVLPNVDLYVSEFVLSPDVPVQKQAVQVRIGVYNRGNTASGPFEVEWWAGKNFPRPERVWHIGSIAGKGGRILTHKYSGYQSWYARLTTRVVIDPAHTSNDRTKNNNIFDTVIQVRKP